MKQHRPRCLSTHGLEPGSGGHKVVVRYRLSTDNYTMFLQGKKKDICDTSWHWFFLVCIRNMAL